MYCEMIFVIDGEITISSGDTDYAVTTGDICLIPSEIPHRTDVYPNRYKRWLLFINPWDFAKIYSSPMLQYAVRIAYKRTHIISYWKKW